MCTGYAVGHIGCEVRNIGPLSFKVCYHERCDDEHIALVLCSPTLLITKQRSREVERVSGLLIATFVKKSDRALGFLDLSHPVEPVELITRRLD